MPASRGKDESMVTISSEFTQRPGILGVLERAVSARILRRLYYQELRLLDGVASGASIR
jgi:hypothetical protein